MERKKQKSTARRRQVLRAAAGGAGLAAGSGLIRGFPTIWAQNIKDIKLVQIGGSYSNIVEIANQASKDLGFTIQMQAIDPQSQTSRTLTQPKSIDVNDLGTPLLYYFVGRNIIQSIPLSKYKHWDRTLPLFTRGEYADGSKVSRQGTCPDKIQYYTASDGKKFASEPTEWLSGIPTLFNADTLGVRPDLIGRPIKSWKELINPEFAGKAALVNFPPVGVMDVAMALEARGDMKYNDKGNMTRDEIDKTIKKMVDLKRAGQFRAFWSNFDESVNLMASGEVAIQSMWSPAVTAVRSRGIPCYYAPLQEGYRSWSSILCPMAHLSGMKLDAAIDYMNWYNSGWTGAFVARQGYYSCVPETAKNFLSADEWDYWYGGKPAAIDIKDPYGNLMEKKGQVRDGGSFAERTGKIACWNTLMDEDRYLTRRWNEFISG